MKTKLIAVWHVEYCYMGELPSIEVVESYEDAKEFIARGFGASPEISCITITGPHQHKVPS